jgi:Eco57I restriction-modification methylase
MEADTRHIQHNLTAFDFNKKFYDRFQKEHAAFLTFIEGISVQADREWYASLILNRLMFVYFIQKKGLLATSGSGYLDGDRDYLSHKLKEVQATYTGQFYSFYRYFLLRLFHEGLSRRERSPELEALLGNVPYLNGGLFDVHVLERDYPDIQIMDDAFEHIFAFFNEFDWYLDDRPLRNNREINPDVLGYIFEKYINQKQMGAYYTKEDITGYISKYTIIPRLLEATEQKCSIAFTPDGFVWALLQRDPGRYIYEAVNKGCDLPLPPEIAAGIADVSQRGDWNKPAPDAYALPTESWREVVARRTRCEEAKAMLASGAITSVNDLITYNLDLSRFAEDVITCSEGVDLLSAFYTSLETITILDPTCGSGAFLFAALNILEPLYEACLDRMQEMVAERDRLDTLERQRRTIHPGVALTRFRDILAQLAKHPNRRYFIHKSIIASNLYGVDIMEEATEICRLRLFLKLVAQIKCFAAIEPLPDIDFNIRAGNALVGFATRAEVERAVTSTLDFDQAMVRIEGKVQEVERSFDHFRSLQTAMTIDSSLMAGMKEQLRARLKELNAELDGYLAAEYGIDRANFPQQEAYEQAFILWRQSHQPFHWFAEFYSIMQRGGFDVIIGNPPYLELQQVKYVPQGYESGDGGAIHAMCIERSRRILSTHGCVSMIVPMALVSTQRMKIVQHILESHGNVWYSHYSWRPGKLFDTVNRALTIFVVFPSDQRKTFSTKYQKWVADSRDMLMYGINYTEVPRQRISFWVPKLGYEIERSILFKYLDARTVLSHFMANSNNRVYYRTTGGLYWKVFTNFAPEFRMNGQSGHSSRETWLALTSEALVYPTIAALSSGVFWWWYTITTNCRDLNPYDLQQFPVCEDALSDVQLDELGKKYLDDIQRNSSMMVRIQKQTGRTETQSFKLQKSKPIIDEIDRVLARHYGFTDEELDFIINYDIKYRMGRGDEGDAAGE